MFLEGSRTAEKFPVAVRCGNGEPCIIRKKSASVLRRHSAGFQPQQPDGGCPTHHHGSADALLIISNLKPFFNSYSNCTCSSQCDSDFIPLALVLLLEPIFRTLGAHATPTRPSGGIEPAGQSYCSDLGSGRLEGVWHYFISLFSDPPTRASDYAVHPKSHFEYQVHLCEFVSCSPGCTDARLEAEARVSGETGEGDAGSSRGEGSGEDEEDVVFGESIDEESQCVRRISSTNLAVSSSGSAPKSLVGLSRTFQRYAPPGCLGRKCRSSHSVNISVVCLKILGCNFIIFSMSEPPGSWLIICCCESSHSCLVVRNV